MLMKHMLLAAFAFSCLSAVAQITVTNSTFPSIGDTLVMSRDQNPALTNAITPPGGSQSWDFSTLITTQITRTAYRPTTDGTHAADFPNAKLATITQANETYYNKSATKFESLGYAGAAPANFQLQVLARFNPPVALRRAPMNFFDINQSVTDLSLPFSLKALPDTLTAQIPGDSIRFRIHYQRLDAVDAWGKCKIPGGEYDVLREKRTEYTTTAVDIKIPVLGWLDLSILLGGGGGGGLGGLIGTDTSVTYHFFNDKVKEEIAVLTLNNEQSEVSSASFKNNGQSVPTKEEIAPSVASINAFPNPAVETVQFTCANLPTNDYTLKIFNIVGDAIWKETYQISGTRVIQVDLSNFKKGTYLYSLSDKMGKVVGTKRLVILKP